jgi:hypothetical protein
MGIAGRGNENDRYRMVAEHGNGLAWGGGNRKGKTRNGQYWEWQNAEWQTTVTTLISSRDKCE